MKAQDDKGESVSGLRLDLMTAKVLVWIASVGRDVDLTREAHIYFFNRYQRLADYHRRRGNGYASSESLDCYRCRQSVAVQGARRRGISRGRGKGFVRVQ